MYEQVTNFHIPDIVSSLCGYSALINKFKLKVPLPAFLSGINKKHHKFKTDNWHFYTPRHAPEDSLQGHLVFALKYEGVDLYILKTLFETIDPTELESMIVSHPGSAYLRRIWFLYEFLMEIKLNLEDAQQGDFTDLISAELQYAGSVRLSRRHRVRNNLPGTRDFCPLIRRTKKLDSFILLNHKDLIIKNIGEVHPDVLLRAVAFLLLEDTKASYAIEGETPSFNRMERWAHITKNAGSVPISHEELCRLQREIMADTRFVHLGYRKEGGFIGTHDRATLSPLPSHISAKPEDIKRLIEGLIETASLLKQSNYCPVLSAALIAFGFVFIHPFEDGNGRIHRYLLHHILAEHDFTPSGILFPISAVISKRIGEYRNVLEFYSKPRLPLIQWRATPKGNVEVLNNTLDIYRYFDATAQAEFIYECLHDTVVNVLPEEVKYLKKYDLMKQFLNNYIEMPERLQDLLIQFLRQNKGELSERARTKEFGVLKDFEILTIEEKYQEIFFDQP